MPLRIFYIECKLKLWYLTILWKSRLEILKGGGVLMQAILEIQVEGRGVQKYACHREGVWIFSGITHSTFFSITYVTKEMVNSSMCNYIGSQRHLEH